MTARSLRPIRFALLAGLVLRMALPWYGHGFRWMDEHWQVIEPANRLVHGVWSQTSEWRDGLRSWIYPGLVSLPMRVAEWIGFSDPLWIAAFTRMVHGLLAALAIPVCFFFVQRLTPAGDSKRWPWALGCAWYVALWPFAIYCGYHTQGEMIGALFVLLGAATPLLMEREAWGYALSGFWFGVALALKIDLAVAGLGYGLWQLLQGRFRRALWMAVGVLPLVVAVGAVDKLTWGSWFHSVLGHARVNLVEHVGDQWGVSPWYTHIFYFYDATGVPALLGTVALASAWSMRGTRTIGARLAGVRAAWRALPYELRATWFMNAFFVAVFCAIPHKEKRFIVPVLYTGIAAGFATLAQTSGALTLKSFAKQTMVWRWTIGIATLVLITHTAFDAVVYLEQRPWWDRLHAIDDAGRIPGIQKMISPQWPAVFYFSRNVPSEIVAPTGGDFREPLRAATRGLHNIGVATDWSELTPFAELGFRCTPWPNPAAASPDPVPRAYRCTR